ncbi:MAG: bifunctional UDP-N-acetylglucosamine diphosphorylase/glucosamine-1-phosphate N-acetyltransferase GlmU [Thermotogae bacterium]|nr:bifunctional UDP-N-acetylglucosamine diphosphorylase/glucosamine-1-phosphate N-acetyltransferase GlmU [Thermotogota bacterium]MCL5033135.1 bifunctional UDP-N-acetylglucosamine diphosphorylase/glucosamine-1-phosphate N-acetyltransferase GlmU [Thermotogota bacterium]
MKKVLILAAGLGKRMNSPRPKVVHEVLGKPLLNWTIDVAKEAKTDEIGVVLGHGAELVYPLIPSDVKIFIQESQVGTANAVKAAKNFLNGKVVILYGDVPLISSEVVNFLFESKANMTILTAILETPFGYGRIVRKDGKVIKIVEENDATDDIRKIKEINSGIYAFDSESLVYALDRIKNNNKKGEYYLTDAVEILLAGGYVVETVQVKNPNSVLGVNTQKELATLIKNVKDDINNALMDAGVTIEEPQTTFVGPDVIVESGAVLKPFTFIYGKSRISSNASIGPATTIVDCTVGNNTFVIRSDCSGSVIGNNCSIGPFSRLRPGTFIEDNVKIGNYVEVKNSHLSKGVKSQHLTYLGDATIGEDTNIGAGTITCNYDGIRKNKTFIGKNVFVGSNTALVAPVKVGDGALIGAGSTITDDVPAYALALGRAKQLNKEEWVLKKRRDSSDEK